MESRPNGVSTLRRYLEALWRRKWIGLVPLIVLPLVVLVASLRQHDLYEASADVLVNRQEAATTSLLGETPALDHPDRTMQTQARLAKVPTVLERTLAAVGDTSTSPTTYRDRSSVFPLDDLLRFSVSDGDASRARQLANAHAREYVRFRRELDTAGLARTLQELRSELSALATAGNVDSPLYVRLADREQQLESLVALRTSNVSVVRTAGADDVEQVAPRPRRNVALAAAVGLFVGLIVIFLAESLTTRPRSDEEFEELLGMPLLGRAGGAGHRQAGARGGQAQADAADALRLNLELANRPVGARTIMFTSPRTREGKSAAVLQLGVALARAGRRARLVDLDLRDSSLTRILRLDERTGVTALARGECELVEALVAIPVDDDAELGVAADSNGREDRAALLEAVASGPPVAHPAGFLSSRRTTAVLAELLGQSADIVLLDVPPVLEVPDAAALAAHVDGVVVVVGDRDARGPTLADTRRVIESWPIARLGFILAQGDQRLSVRRLDRGALPAPAIPTESERVA